MQSHNIFILDDDYQFSVLIKEMLSIHGLASTVFQCASELMEADLPKTGVLILDLIMPDMDGIEVIRQLSDKLKNFSLILISGFDNRVLHSAKQFAETHNINVIATLTKPITPDQLEQAVTSIKSQSQKPDIKKSEKNIITTDDVINGIKNNEFVVFYQAQNDLKTHDIIGFEALSRWQHPTLGLLFPDSFIPLAEKNKFINTITMKVVEHVCRDISQHYDKLCDLSFSINVSAQDIESLSFPEEISNICDKYGIHPSRINLELTETSAMIELASALDVLNRLRMKGFNLSIDDFGTGYSSLAQLYKAPFSELKVDKSFVGKLLEENEAYAIVSICIKLSHLLNMKVVAEGAEDAASIQALKNLGCDVAQGYYYSKPIPLNEALKLLPSD